MIHWHDIGRMVYCLYMKVFTRKLQRMGSHSYVLNIPKELIDEFGWKERQKLAIAFGGRNNRLTIKDLKRKKRT